MTIESIVREAKRRRRMIGMVDNNVWN